jgi:hypothetical protein
LQGDGLAGRAVWHLTWNHDLPGRFPLDSLGLAIRSARWGDDSPVIRPNPSPCLSPTAANNGSCGTGLPEAWPIHRDSVSISAYPPVSSRPWTSNFPRKTRSKSSATTPR